jgi:hypothetical protein
MIPMIIIIIIINLKFDMAAESESSLSSHQVLNEVKYMLSTINRNIKANTIEMVHAGNLSRNFHNFFVFPQSIDREDEPPIRFIRNNDPYQNADFMFGQLTADQWRSLAEYYGVLTDDIRSRALDIPEEHTDPTNPPHKLAVLTGIFARAKWRSLVVVNDLVERLASILRYRPTILDAQALKEIEQCKPWLLAASLNNGGNKVMKTRFQGTFEDVQAHAESFFQGI